MIFRIPAAVACLVAVTATACTASTHAAKPSVGASAATASSASPSRSSTGGAARGGTSAVPSGARPSTSGSRPGGAPAGVPTSLSALPTVPGAAAGSTPPMTPVGRLNCPAADKVSTAFGTTFTGGGKDMDPSASNVLCSYAASGSDPVALSISSAEDGHAGYVGKAANLRAMAASSGTVQPVLGLGDEAVVDMEHDGSATWAAQLLVRFGPRTVLVVCNARTSTLQRLAQVAELMY